MQPDFLTALHTRWQSLLTAQTRLTVALSGGLDSMVLLHLLWRLQQQLPFALQAVHIHHGLQAQADDWLAFCQTCCAKWHIPLHTHRVQVQTAGLGLEAAARQARYAVFANTDADIIALAHHADDQVETFMLAALRGGGLRALSAMPALRPLNEHTQLWRPLLPYHRADLLAYATQHQLAYVEDPSNNDGIYLRNWLRHQGLPAWQTRMPQLARHILSSVALLQDELALLDEIIANDAAQVMQNGYFDCATWRLLSAPRRRQQLLRYAQQHQVGPINKATLADFDRVLYNLGAATAQWQLPNGEIRAYQNRLFALPPHWQHKLLPPTTQGCLQELFAATPDWQCLPLAYGLPLSALQQHGTIRRVQQHDTLSWGNGQKNVLQLLQECHVPPFIRPYWAVITDSHDQCIAVPNIAVAKHLASANGYLPTWSAFTPFVLRPKKQRS